MKRRQNGQKRCKPRTKCSCVTGSTDHLLVETLQMSGQCSVGVRTWSQVRRKIVSYMQGPESMLANKNLMYNYGYYTY